MLNNNSHVSDLTVEELVTLIRSVLREELSHEQPASDQARLIELQPLHVGQWPSDLKLLSRDEFYDDER